MSSSAFGRRLTRQLILFFSLFPFTVTGGCAHDHQLVPRERAFTTSPPLQWFSPTDAKDETPLARWRSGVGPPLFQEGRNQFGQPGDELTVVTWNTAVGAGDLRQVLAGLPQSRPMVLLLQEVYRGGDDVPGALPPGAVYARRLGGEPGDSRYEQIQPIATALGLSLFYVPSMRNGGANSREDRGNAILSNVPLTDLAAYELPFERQRRVALAATIAGTTTDGTPWRLRIVNAHLDNTFSPRRLWLASEYRPDAPGARTRRHTRQRGTAHPRRRLQYLVRILGSGLPDPRAPIPRRPRDRSPGDVSRCAETRPPVLQARTRMECNVPSSRPALPLRSLSARRHRTLSQNQVEPVEPCRTPIPLP